MEFVAQFWQIHRDLDIWVSDFDSNLNYNHPIFQWFGVPNHQLRFNINFVGANPLWLPINRGRHEIPVLFGSASYQVAHKSG